MAAAESLAIVERFWDAMGRNDWVAAGRLLHDEFVLDWPQSGERLRGRDAFVAVNAHYPSEGPWRFTVNRLIADARCVASDVSVTDGAVRARVVGFHEIRDGAIWRATELWPDPFPAPEWRAAWVERFDPEG